MTRIIYVNGQYLEHRHAGLPVEDRSCLFGDGVYDAFELRQGRIIDLEGHLNRLFRSMKELRFSNIPSRKYFEHIVRETVRRNRYVNGFVYLQVSRGVAARNFLFPAENTALSIVCLVYNVLPEAMEEKAQQGVKVTTCRDIRWKRPDIKTLQLLPAVLAKQEAHEKGAFETWMVDEQGFVTEGGSSNAWIVTSGNELITRPTDGSILKGVTRDAVMKLLEKEKLTLTRRAFGLQEALEAKEAFITACTIKVMPVVSIDETIIGDGKPGKIALGLRKHYQQNIW